MTKYIESFNTIQRAILDFDSWDLMEPHEGESPEGAYENFAHMLAGHIHDSLVEHDQADVSRRHFIEADLEVAKKHSTYYSDRVTKLQSELDEINGN